MIWPGEDRAPVPESIASRCLRHATFVAIR